MIHHNLLIYINLKGVSLLVHNKYISTTKIIYAIMMVHNKYISTTKIIYAIMMELSCCHAYAITITYSLE